MNVEMTHPETNEKIEIEVDDIDVDELKERFKSCATEERLKRIIDNLDVSPEVKAMLSELLKISIKVGTVVLEVGKKIIEVIKVLVEEYPHITAGLVVGVAIGILLNSIPVLGWLLGWLLLPLCAALGLALGVWKEFGNSDLGYAVEDVVKSIFSGLKKIPEPA